MNKFNIKLIYEKHLKTAEGTRTVRVNTPPKKGNHRQSDILYSGEYDNSQCRQEDEYTGYGPNRKMISEKAAEILVD